MCKYVTQLLIYVYLRQSTYTDFHTGWVFYPKTNIGLYVHHRFCQALCLLGAPFQVFGTCLTDACNLQHEASGKQIPSICQANNIYIYLERNTTQIESAQKICSPNPRISPKFWNFGGIFSIHQIGKILFVQRF